MIRFIENALQVLTAMLTRPTWPAHALSAMSTTLSGCAVFCHTIWQVSSRQITDETTSDMMYSGGGSSCDSGQMAMGQTMMYQPGPSPTANWLETAQQSEHKRRQIQQQKQDDGQPVAVRVITSDSGAPSERSDNYVPPPFARGQQPQQPASPSSHLDLLYERAQQPVQSPSSVMPATTSPHADGVYRSLGRAVPAPVHHHNHHQQQALSTAAARTSTETDEYNALSRATPAPIQQHAAAAAAERVPTSFPAGAVDTAGTSSHCTTSIQHNNSLPPTAQVTNYRCCLCQRTLHATPTN